MPRRSKQCVLAFQILIGLAAPVAAQKTDVIVMTNDDSYTGEIKSYSAGRLLLDTDNAGDVREIVSDASRVSSVV